MGAEDPGSDLCCAMNCLSGLGHISYFPSMVLIFFIYKMSAFARKPLSDPDSQCGRFSHTLPWSGMCAPVCLPISQGTCSSANPPHGAPSLPPVFDGDPEPEGPQAGYPGQGLSLVLGSGNSCSSWHWHFSAFHAFLTHRGPELSLGKWYLLYLQRRAQTARFWVFSWPGTERWSGVLLLQKSRPRVGRFSW